MKKIIFIVWIAISFLGALPASAPAQTEYPQIYQFYMEIGKEAMARGDYPEAYDHFRHAQLVCPSEKDPAYYINLILSQKSGRLQPASIDPDPFEYPARAQTLRSKTRDQMIQEALDTYSSPDGHLQTTSPITRPKEQPVEEKTVPVQSIPSPRTPSDPKQPNMVYLDDELWQKQPGTVVRLELLSSVVLESNDIQRYLAIAPDLIEVKRIDRRRILVTGLKRGSSVFHVWDDRGRWTFTLEIILPLLEGSMKGLPLPEGSVAPFNFTYSGDWGSYYRGPSYPEVERQNLSFLQRVVMKGGSPYGDLDSHVLFEKFDESTEVTGYGAGLTNGKIGNFKDFNVRIFDVHKAFSPLTLPGQYVRGVFLEAKAFQKNLGYTYIHGRDQAVYGYLSPGGGTNKKESFVEGAKVTLFPEKENKYSLIYARGYGDAHEAYWKDYVYSLEGKHRFMDILFSGELARDETDQQALLLRSDYERENYSLSITGRDMDDDFASVTSSPGNQGEVGGSLNWNWRLEDVNVATFLDLYRQRYQMDPDNSGTVNVDFSSSVEIPVGDTDTVRSSIYYVDTSGELSPRNSEWFNTTYTKNFRLLDRDVSVFWGGSQERNRYEFSPASEFDRYGVSGGFSVPLYKPLSYFVNYENSWVYEEFSGDHWNPNVLNTGLNYSKLLTKFWSVNSSFIYRDEEKTEGSNSFLAGEDSITGSLGFTFRPHNDFEFYVDGRTRNVWAEANEREAYNEIDVRTGVRTSWETPLVWNPRGTVAGVVYRDLNGNQTRDPEEPGIPDVTVHVGKNTVVTDAAGYYRCVVKAKSAEVTPVLDTIPGGYVFSTAATSLVDVQPLKLKRVDFGLSVQSGIYGIVYYDRNLNDKPDVGDVFFPKVKMILDGKQTAISDFEGTYHFDDASPGRHVISFDLNSIPPEYLPGVKLKSPIDISDGSTCIFHIPLKKVQTNNED